MSGGNGILYVLNNAGELTWFKHENYAGGQEKWANSGMPKKIGEADSYKIDPATGGRTYIGWNNARYIISGGNGIIYMIDARGDLYWNRHLGYQDGTDRWENRKKVGSGWQNLKQVFSGGDGIIYAVTRDNALIWQNHEGFASGEAIWANGGTLQQIGSEWRFKVVF